MEYAFSVYPNADGAVVIVQDQVVGIGGVTLGAVVSPAQVPELIDALSKAKAAVADSEAVSEFKVGASEVYLSEGGNVCIIGDPGDEPMVFEPYRVDALIAAVRQAAVEATA
ncbi:hypothetical protein [Myxococcus virescens]|uniref:hypothetical protein n=1 Tax=Myxococcus virescens TaxID=83456 RepID=UPI00115FBCC1|nr:hypothetical protein [Myxococcus virescens]